MTKNDNSQHPKFTVANEDWRASTVLPEEIESDIEAASSKESKLKKNG